MSKKILILYTSVGLGHKFIALNIAHHLESAGYEIKLGDVLKVQSGLMVKIGEWFHRLINQKFPFVWRWLYFSKTFAKLTMPLRVPLAAGNSENVKQLILDFKPDIVIATQTSASAPVAYLKKTGIYKGKFVIAFSDYHFHPYWWYKEADHYLVNIEEQKEQLERLNVSSDEISVCGITLQPQVEIDKESVKQKLGLQGKRVVLMASGSLGIGFPEDLLFEYAIELADKVKDAHLIVVSGKNEGMKHHLEQLITEKNLSNISVVGFYEPFYELMGICDVFLTKPGGLTVAEALRDNIKMITTHFLPGQEELNYKYLTDRRLMFPIPSPLTAENLVKITSVIMDGKTQVENPNSKAITQKNNEGKVIIKSIENLFHNV